MKLYAGTTEQFRADAQMHRIAEKLRAEYTTQIGHKPSPNEVASWQNSLMALQLLLDQAQLHDHGVILEYQLGNTSRRLDAMLTGHAATSAENAVVVELKQWSGANIGPSTADNCVELYVGKQVRRVLHPSVQVGGYQQWLLDNHSVFYEPDAVALTAVSFLHNFQYDPANELWADRHTEALHRNPLFTGDQSAELAELLNQHLSAGEGATVMNRVLESSYRPSRKLLEHTAAMIAAQSDFVLLDEQRVAFESVLAEANAGYHDAKKSVVLVQGGPGTGKSIIALHLVGELAKRGYNAMHATGSKAFTENMRRVVGSRAGQSQFRYFNQFGNAAANDVDVLILDEAHRLRETSASRFTPKAKRTDIPQVDELIQAAKTTVFFIDDEQTVRPNEVGSTQGILEAAERNGADVSTFELETQFRLAGSKAFLQWVDGMLGIAPSPQPTWDPDRETFDFRIVDSVEQLDALIRSKANEGHSARLTGGFCWPWSNPEPDGTLVNDVKVGAWQMPWNARPDAGRLAPDIPPSNFWASDPNGINQVGCVYTAQGFEFDFAGVIWGRDLRWDPATNDWIGDSSESYDSIVKRSGDRFTDLVKRTYRVLLTRGLKGCYVCFVDARTLDRMRRVNQHDKEIG